MLNQSNLGRFLAVFLCFANWASAELLAVDLRSDVGGRDVMWRVNYVRENTPQKQPASVIPVSMPEEIIGDPIVDGFVAPEFASGMSESWGSGGCGPSCGPACGPSCGPACGPSCGGCGLCSSGNIWGSVEFVNWWQRSIVSPELVTDGSLPNSTVFAGNERLFDESRAGMRMSLGWWNPCRPWGVLARWYKVQDAGYDFRRAGDGDVVNLARPFYNMSVNGGFIVGDDLLDVAFGGDPGAIRIVGESRFDGGDILLRRPVHETNRATIDMLLGYSTALIDEGILISSNSVLQDGEIAVADQFSTQNRFHGATVGVLSQRQFDCLTFEMLGKISFGGARQTAVVAGTTNGATGGLLAQPGNSGEFKQNVFVVAPEVGLNMIYHPTPCLDITCGYSLLYWSSAAQATNLIDPLLRVNPNNPPAVNDFAQPGFEFRDSEYLLHGLNVGLRFSF